MSCVPFLLNGVTIWSAGLVTELPATDTVLITAGADSDLFSVLVLPVPEPLELLPLVPAFLSVEEAPAELVVLAVEVVLVDDSTEEIAVVIAD